MNLVVITGASSGLGYSLAKFFYNRGTQVLCVSRESPDLDIDFLSADLRIGKEVERVIQKIKSDYEGFSALICCAGVLEIQNVETIDRSGIENQFTTNVFPILQMVGGLHGSIVKNDADLVIVGSTSAFKAVDGQLVYSASKWALRGIIEGLQREFSSTGCRVIGIHPGGFESNLYRRATGEALPKSEPWMSVDELANVIGVSLLLPKSMEISQLIINRKRST